MSSPSNVSTRLTIQSNCRWIDNAKCIALDGGSWSSAIGSYARCTIVGALFTILAGMCAAHDSWIFVVIPDVKAKSAWIDVPVAPQEQCTENRLGHDIEYTIKDGLAVGTDDVPTLTQTPSNRVEEPEEDGPYTGNEEDFADVCADVIGVFAGGPSDGPGNHKEGKHAECPVAPLQPRISIQVSGHAENRTNS